MEDKTALIGFGIVAAIIFVGIVWVNYQLLKGLGGAYKRKEK